MGQVGKDDDEAVKWLSLGWLLFSAAVSLLMSALRIIHCPALHNFSHSAFIFPAFKLLSYQFSHIHVFQLCGICNFGKDCHPWYQPYCIENKSPCLSSHTLNNFIRRIPMTVIVSFLRQSSRQTSPLYGHLVAPLISSCGSWIVCCCSSRRRSTQSRLTQRRTASLLPGRSH